MLPNNYLVKETGDPPLPKFNYKEIEKWGALHPQYAACSSGMKQSPIDITTSEATLDKNLQPLLKGYLIENATLACDGIDVEVIFSAKGGLEINGKTYYLKQIHWHTPSEHRFDGVKYEAELHHVHQATDGNRAVVGIVFKLGQPNPLLTMLKPQLEELAKLPCQHEEPKIPIPKFDSSFLTKHAASYYRYAGSLTSPPCEENVLWSVISEVQTISKEQIKLLKAPLCQQNLENARPTKPLNGRMVKKYECQGAKHDL